MTLSDGFRLSIAATASPPPPLTTSDEAMDKVKQAMSKRFQSATNALDLKKFHADASFLGEPIYACLNRSAMLKEVVKVISENIPQLAALEMSENRMATLDVLEALTEKTPNVTVLHLADNYVSVRYRFDICN